MKLEFSHGYVDYGEFQATIYMKCFIYLVGTGEAFRAEVEARMVVGQAIDTPGNVLQSIKVIIS